ncbi:MAG TPA: ATP-binding protein [Dehalococcoidia bacterium]|nr:ATP-binding protein [Dehalococcoidia bacterium]
MKSLNEILKQPGWRDATPPGNGVPAPDLPEEDDACLHCGGAGYVRRPVRLGHPDFGRAFPCRCVENEREEERVARLQRYSNLGPLSRLTFENLSPRGRSPNQIHQERFADAVKAARRFAAEPDGWLVFTGPNGCGKTHLAAAVTVACIEAGCAALFMVVPDLLDHLRAAYKPDNEVGYDELFELLKSAPVLVLDDLGVQSATPWAQEKLFQLVNHRYNARIPTIFTTNLPLDAFDARLRARLSDPDLAQVYYFESGPDAWASDLDSLDLPLLRGMTFKTFDVRLVANDSDELKQVQNAYRQAMNFAQEPKDWLVIAGATGRGKTRLAAAIGNFCREAGTQTMFVVVPDLLDSLRSSYDPGNPKAFDEMFEHVRNVPLLILDDLGSQSGTAWAEEKLFQLINHRYNACLPTVITTNLTIGAMESRLASRLTDPQVSTILLMGRFDFWGKGAAAARQAPGRGRPRRT